MTSRSPVSPIKGLACKRCRARKIKCGAEYPTCSGCRRAKARCIVADPSASSEYTREEAYQLEAKVRALYSTLESSPVSTSRPPVPGFGPGPASEARRFVGGESGDSFVRYICHAVQTRVTPRAATSAAAAPLLHTQPLHTAPAPSQALPPRSSVDRIIGDYLDEFHVIHPLLDADELRQTVARLYEEPSYGSSPRLEDARPRHHRFQLYMALALGSIRTSFRDGEDPAARAFGFFTTALQVLSGPGFCFDSLDDIVDFLLVARFGVYLYIGCSIWELSHLCTRMCIEQGLQCHDATAGDDSDRRCIVFWECYCLDRLSATLLGRPFGIEDDDITVRPPSHRISPVFARLVVLAQISSGIKDALPLRGPNPASPIHIHAHVATLHGRLDTWRHSNKSASLPTTGGASSLMSSSRCVYESPAYLDLCYHKERLFLFREAIDRVVSPSTLPPNALLRPCSHSAAAVVRLFAELRDNPYMAFTRSYAHLIFLSGMVLVFTAFVEGSSSTNGDSSGEAVSSCWKEAESALEAGGFTLSGHQEDEDDNETAEAQQERLVGLLLGAQQSLLLLSRNMPDLSAHAELLEAFRTQLPQQKQQSPQRPAQAARGGRAAAVIEQVVVPLADTEVQQQQQSGLIEGIEGNDAVMVATVADTDTQNWPWLSSEPGGTGGNSLGNGHNNNTVGELQPNWPLSYLPLAVDQWELDFTNYDWMPSSSWL